MTNMAVIDKIEKESLTDAIYDYLVDYLGVDSKDEITHSDLVNYLEEISSEKSNLPLVDALNNLILINK